MAATEYVFRILDRDHVVVSETHRALRSDAVAMREAARLAGVHGLRVEVRAGGEQIGIAGPLDS